MKSINGKLDKDFKPIDLAPLRGLPICVEFGGPQKYLHGNPKRTTTIVGVLEGFVLNEDPTENTLELHFFGKIYKLYEGEEYKIMVL